MNEVKITVELCSEDRALLSKLTNLLEARVAQSQFVIEQEYDNDSEVTDAPKKAEKAKQNDDLDQALREVLAEAPKNAQDEPKASDHPTLDPFPEQPTEAKPAPTESVKAVSASDFQQLAIALCRQKKQPEIKKVLTEYGLQTVSEVLTKVPEEKRGEVYDKLKALEG
jgi:hypothetical protein